MVSTGPAVTFLIYIKDTKEKAVKYKNTPDLGIYSV